MIITASKVSESVSTPSTPAVPEVPKASTPRSKQQIVSDADSDLDDDDDDEDTDSEEGKQGFLRVFEENCPNNNKINVNSG